MISGLSSVDTLLPYVLLVSILSDDGGKTPLSEHRFAQLYANYSKDIGISYSSRQLRHSYATVVVEEDIFSLKTYKMRLAMQIIQKVADKLNSRYSKQL